MRKISTLTLLSALSCHVYAGEMGINNATSCFSSFVALEGGYTKAQANGYNFTLAGVNGQLSSTKKTNGYTGRLGAGLMRMVDDDIGLSSEIGYGFYGRSTLNPYGTGLVRGITANNFSIKNTLTGFDALVGISYVDVYYSVFLKGGALIQNMDTKLKADLSSLGFTAFDQSLNNTGVLPEIKLGAAYNYDNNWSITASYFHAFGASPKTSGTFDTNTLSATFTTSNRNPSINTVLLGVQYTI